MDSITILVDLICCRNTSITKFDHPGQRIRKQGTTGLTSVNHGI
ncbi:hypothetical protein SLEP1_g10720 [Rubroshorea leprosula]|uniref:Uncharacterized protein n=1 Tax=Rubroshorea leprosula TaxID=152421 RepID=A0AAV5IEP4_9ROSI|nr:hypothetical protein SLEP1_g10720 [Rubroshorea leprosula]